MAKIVLEEQVTPSTPSVNKVALYPKIGGGLFKKDDVGTEEKLLTDSELTSTSGVLQSQIDSKSDVGHIHDGRYYTESETDTISGSLSTEIDSDISTHSSSGDHDDRYYTESEVDDLITTISGKLDDHDELNNLDYASAGHTGFQPAGDYLTETEIDTISGTLNTKIDGKDNYSSWNFAVDGVTKDAVTSGDVLDFVGGDNITINRSADDQITISGIGAGASVSDIAYDATSWNGVTTIAPSKNAVRDKIENLGTGDVTAAANIDANAVVVGDDGAKGVKSCPSAITDTTLSGTPKVFTLYDSGGTPYYFKAYPNKA